MNNINKEIKSGSSGEQLLFMLGDIDCDLIEETKFFTEEFKFSKGRRRRLGITIIAAVLVLALGITSFAINKNQWNIDIINYMGLGNADTTQLTDGSVEISAIDTKIVLNRVTGTEDEIWMKADSSIGDNMNTYIKVQSNIVLPKELCELPGYFMAEFWDMNISDKKEESLGKQWGGSLEAILEEDGLSFMINLQDVEDLNTSYVTLTLGEIVYNINWDDIQDASVQDGEILTNDYVKNLKAQGIEELKIYDEDWTMSWKYSYKSPQVTKSIREKVEIGDLTCILTNLRITPLEVSISGHVAYTDWKKDMPKNPLHIEKILMNDGSEIILDGHTGISYGRGIKNLIPTYYISIYENVAGYKTVLNPDEVKSVFVNGIEITVA